jgi:nucleoside-diphosphate kinase
MAIEQTFSIIKPDATRRNLTGAINAIYEKNGLRIVAQKRIWMSRAHAKKFYEVHAARPFYNDLVDFMVSGPVVVQVLEGENAVAKHRELMGATNPANAAEGTVRKLFAEFGPWLRQPGERRDRDRVFLRRQRDRRLNLISGRGASALPGLARVRSDPGAIPPRRRVKAPA